MNNDRENTSTDIVPISVPISVPIQPVIDVEFDPAESAESMDKISRDVSSRNVKVVFANEDIAAMGRELSDKVRRVTGLEEDKKAYVSQVKADIAEAEAARNKLVNKIRDGYEFQTVAVEVIRNFTAKTVTVVRSDTGEVLEDRAMRGAEAQMELELDDN